MKSIFTLSKTILGAGLILCSLNSCKKEPKMEDPKEVAEDQNDAKFDDLESKEDDSKYLVDIAEIDIAEIEIGKLAQQKSTNKEVKDFGKMLVDDHTKSSTQLKAIADKNGITLPTSITDMGKEEYNKLNEKSGADFDKKFADMMVDGHEKAVDKMTKIAKDATNEEIKVWATDRVAALTGHLEHAKRLKEKLNKK